MELTADRLRTKIRNHKAGPIGKHRYYSVLVPFVEREGKLYLMYEVRAGSLRTQPGEICFPGGRAEAGESFRDAAFRETAEETGLDESVIEYLGQGDILYGYADYTLYTFAGLINYDDYLRAAPCRDEVDELFLVPVEELQKADPDVFGGRVVLMDLDPGIYEEAEITPDYKWRQGRWQSPVYKAGGRIIWGITARITASYMNLLAEDDISK